MHLLTPPYNLLIPPYAPMHLLTPLTLSSQVEVPPPDKQIGLPGIELGIFRVDKAESDRYGCVCVYMCVYMCVCINPSLCMYMHLFNPSLSMHLCIPSLCRRNLALKNGRIETKEELSDDEIAAFPDSRAGVPRGVFVCVCVCVCVCMCVCVC
jgi:hypothetical protein